MSIKVLAPGLATTVQDLGRPGYYHLGIPLSGAMDQMALRAANLLVGNDEGAAGLEAVFMGPKLEFTRDAIVAVTGAEMEPRVDGVSQDHSSAFAVKAGQVLSFGTLRSGARIYIAIVGGIDVPITLGSRATYALGALGGFQGRALAAGDELPFAQAAATATPGRSLPGALRIPPATPAEIRVLPGLYWHRITEEAQDVFFADTWAVAPEADRIGYRFRGGTALAFNDREQPFGAGSDPSNITDACYPYGSVQVPGGTEPIILHRDAVSGGGYCMIGTVISADMDATGQLQPHHKTRFVKVTMDEALDVRRERASHLEKLRTALRG